MKIWEDQYIQISIKQNQTNFKDFELIIALDIYEDYFGPAVFILLNILSQAFH